MTKYSCGVDGRTLFKAALYEGPIMLVIFLCTSFTFLVHFVSFLYTFFTFLVHYTFLVHAPAVERGGGEIDLHAL